MKQLASILYGSQNYGLSTPESDKDYKALMCPSFDELYEGRKVTKQDLPGGYDPEHYSVMSVVNFNRLLLNGNPNCIELLYSVEYEYINVDLMRYFDMAREMYSKGYVALVLREFYSALRGMMFNPVDRCGINGKTVSRAYYLYCLFEHIINDGYVISEVTFRNDSEGFKHARIMRDGEENDKALISIVNKLKMLWYDNNQLTHMALDFMWTHSALVKELEQMRNELENEMKKVVRMNM